jgi:hypothetical protein
MDPVTDNRPILRVSPGDVVRVVWRERTWRCELSNAGEAPVLRLYEWENLQMAHPVTTDTINAAAAIMRRAVRGYLASEDRLREMPGAIVTPRIVPRG